MSVFPLLLLSAAVSRRGSLPEAVMSLSLRFSDPGSRCASHASGQFLVRFESHTLVIPVAFSVVTWVPPSTSLPLSPWVLAEHESPLLGMQTQGEPRLFCTLLAPTLH